MRLPPRTVKAGARRRHGLSPWAPPNGAALLIPFARSGITVAPLCASHAVAPQCCFPCFWVGCTGPQATLADLLRSRLEQPPHRPWSQDLRVVARGRPTLSKRRPRTSYIATPILHKQPQDLVLSVGYYHVSLSAAERYTAQIQIQSCVHHDRATGIRRIADERVYAGGRAIAACCMPSGASGGCLLHRNLPTTY
jgi:hypothetical protein